MLILGIILIVYGAICIIISALKPGFIWNMGKIQVFVKILGDRGTVIFIAVWGAIAAGVGIYLTVINIG